LGQKYPLAVEAAVLIDPASGVEPCLGENRLAAGEEVAKAIGDPLVRCPTRRHRPRHRGT
jgi:hypothetical protein